MILQEKDITDYLVLQAKVNALAAPIAEKIFGYYQTTYAARMRFYMGNYAFVGVTNRGLAYKTISDMEPSFYFPIEYLFCDYKAKINEQIDQELLRRTTREIIRRLEY